MSSFPTLHLVAWIFFVSVETSTSDIVRRELTNQRVEIHSEDKEEFPSILPVVLKSPDQIVNLSFAKQNVDYNLPVYMRQKDGKTILLDTPRIMNAALYEDPRYDASITLHCEENDPLFSMQTACNTKLMSGYFALNGYRYVIEPKQRIFKRFIIYTNQNSREMFAERHQVFKLHTDDHECPVKNHNKQYFNSTINSNVNFGKERLKRGKIKNTIEVMAVFTHKVPINQEEIKMKKIYIIHTFWGVNRLYNNINMSDMSFGVNLLGFILEPNETPLYVFPDSKNRTGHLNHGKSLNALAKFKTNYPCDHITLFSIHNLNANPGVVGYATVSAMCTANSVSIVRELGNFQEVFTLSHEIGHSMGSIHDGENNACQKDGGYVMASLYVGNPTIQQALNHFKFSSCSQTYMRDYLKTLTTNCLLTPIKLPIVPQIPTGQLFRAREQCKAMSNTNIGVCPYPIFRNVSTLCLFLWCDIGHFRCIPYVPAFKTTCGNKKWCVYGYCVYDDKAPMADETCLFGDDEKLGISVQLLNGTDYKPTTCAELIQLTPGFCQNSTHKRKCCDTCFQLAHPGNRMTTPSSLTTTLSVSISEILTQSTTTISSDSTELKSLFLPVILAVLQLFSIRELLYVMTNL